MFRVQCAVFRPNDCDELTFLGRELASLLTMREQVLGPKSLRLEFVRVFRCPKHGVQVSRPSGDRLVFSVRTINCD